MNFPSDRISPMRYEKHPTLRCFFGENDRKRHRRRSGRAKYHRAQKNAAPFTAPFLSKVTEKDIVHILSKNAYVQLETAGVRSLLLHYSVIGFLQIPLVNILVGLTTGNHAGLPISHKHHRRPRLPIVVTSHGGTISTGTKDRHNVI